jgi:hypothetical protein
LIIVKNAGIVVVQERHLISQIQTNTPQEITGQDMALVLFVMVQASDNIH